MSHVPGSVPRLGKERLRIGVTRSEQVGHLVKFLGIEPFEVCSYDVHECCRLPEAPGQGAIPCLLILLATVTVRAGTEKLSRAPAAASGTRSLAIFLAGAESLGVVAGSGLAEPSRSDARGRPRRGGCELDNTGARKTAPYSACQRDGQPG